MANAQAKIWEGSFGTQYIDRNFFTPTALDKVYQKVFGEKWTDLMKSFFGKLHKDIRILEVGCNVGNQLLTLQKLGFTQLYGIEVNPNAIERSKKRFKGINIIRGYAQDIPYKDGFFDLVFTAGVLIHIPPSDIKKVMKEMIRCSNKYIWGYESYAKKYQPVNYRGNKNMYWKGDFSVMFQQLCVDFKCEKTHMLKCLSNDEVDYMYLLKKK